MPVQLKLWVLMTNDTSRITKVTTRNGDNGQTRLATNIKVSKADPWVRALGSTDELNSAIGLLRCHLSSAELDNMLAQHQQLMFDIGAVLAMGGDFDTPAVAAGLTDVTSNTEMLNDQLPPLKEFVIPGGSLAAAHAHMCRTICRRAETDIWAAIETWESALATDNIARLQETGACLNRLSDFFFVLARQLMQGQQEPQWRGPEKNEEQAS
jgi:cob(I)alamin adenosyltransferase